MPNTKSAAKRLRQNVARRDRNRAVKSIVRTQIRKVREAISSGDFEKADGEYRLACKKLDQAGARRAIHPNQASRLKSRLNHSLKKAKQGEG